MPEEPSRSGSTASLDAPEHAMQAFDAANLANDEPENGPVPAALTPPRRRGGARRSLPR